MPPPGRGLGKPLRMGAFGGLLGLSQDGHIPLNLGINGSIVQGQGLRTEFVNQASFTHLLNFGFYVCSLLGFLLSPSDLLLVVGLYSL